MSKVFSVDRKRVQEWCKQKDDLMATGRSAKRQEDPEEDYADVEIVSNVEEPKLDLYSCLRTVILIVARIYAAKPIARSSYNYFSLTYCYFSNCFYCCFTLILAGHRPCGLLMTIQLAAHEQNLKTTNFTINALMRRTWASIRDSESSSDVRHLREEA